MSQRDRRGRILRLIDDAGRVTVADLASRFQISEMTARRDLDQLAADDLVVRVRGGAARTRSRSRPSTRAGVPDGPRVGIVVPTTDYVYRSILAGIDRTLDRADASSTLLVSTYSPEQERVLVDQLLAQGVDGLLFAPTIDEDKLDREFLDWLTGIPVPVVLLDRRLPDTWPGHSLTSVRNSFARGLTLAVTHLTELGHTKIGFFGHARRMNLEAVERLWAEIGSRFDLAAAASPLVIDRDYVHWQSSMEPERVMSRILDAGATAMICRDDPVALTMAHCARRMQIRIPEELSLMAYDDEIATMSDPPLTAVSTPKATLGQRATSLLLDGIRDHRQGEPGSPIHLELEPSIVIRSSTAPPPGTS